MQRIFVLKQTHQNIIADKLKLKLFKPAAPTDRTF